MGSPYHSTSAQEAPSSNPTLVQNATPYSPVSKHEITVASTRARVTSDNSGADIFVQEDSPEIIVDMLNRSDVISAVACFTGSCIFCTSAFNLESEK